MTGVPMAERSGLKTVLSACKFCAAYLLKSQTAGNRATNRTNLRIAAVRKTNCGGKPHALDTGVVPFSRKTCQTRKKRARKSAIQNSGGTLLAACSARKTYENGEAKELTIKERLYLGKIKKEQETAQKAGRGKRERRWKIRHSF